MLRVQETCQNWQNRKIAVSMHKSVTLTNKSDHFWNTFCTGKYRFFYHVCLKSTSSLHRPLIRFWIVFCWSTDETNAVPWLHTSRRFNRREYCDNNTNLLNQSVGLDDSISYVTPFWKWRFFFLVVTALFFSYAKKLNFYKNSVSFLVFQSCLKAGKIFKDILTYPSSTKRFSCEQRAHNKTRFKLI